MADFSVKLEHRGKAGGGILAGPTWASELTGLIEWEQWRRQTNCLQYLVPEESKTEMDSDCAAICRAKLGRWFIPGGGESRAAKLRR